MDLFSGISLMIDRLCHFNKPNITNGREAVRKVVETSNSGLNKHFVSIAERKFCNCENPRKNYDSLNKQMFCEKCWRQLQN